MNQLYKPKRFSHHLLPIMIRIEIDDGTTLKSVSDKIIRFLDEELERQISYALKQSVFKKLSENSISLFILEESNRSIDDLLR